MKEQTNELKSWKLKPCPFCGGEAEIFKTAKIGVLFADDAVEAYYIACRCCNAKIKSVNKLSDAKEAWNRRVCDE